MRVSNWSKRFKVDGPRDKNWSVEWTETGRSNRNPYRHNEINSIGVMHTAIYRAVESKNTTGRSNGPKPNGPIKLTFVFNV